MNRTMLFFLILGILMCQDDLVYYTPDPALYGNWHDIDTVNNRISLTANEESITICNSDGWFRSTYNWGVENGFIIIPDVDFEPHWWPGKTFTSVMWSYRILDDTLIQMISFPTNSTTDTSATFWSTLKLVD